MFSSVNDKCSAMFNGLYRESNQTSVEMLWMDVRWIMKHKVMIGIPEVWKIYHFLTVSRWRQKIENSDY